MLGRDSGVGHQPACGLFDGTICRIFLQIVDEEVGGSLHHGIVFRQERLVACIEIMLPEMRGEPGTACGEHTPGGAVDGAGDAPEVGIVVGHPSFAAVHLLGGPDSRLTQVADHREERLLRFGEVADEGRPVVHLGIDVDGIFRVPRCVQLVVPDTLQVGGLSTGLRGGDEQITAVLHHQRHHVEVGTVKCGEALVGGEFLVAVLC